MFGGINALHCPQNRLYTSPADNLPRFEFSDKDCAISGFLLHNRQRSIGQKRAGLLGDIFDHPLLYRHYPEIAQTPFELQWHRKFAGASFKSEKLYCKPGIASDSTQLRRMFCHEAQHIVQLIENFSNGGSSQAIFNEMAARHRAATGERHPGIDTARKFRREAETRYLNLPGEKEAYDAEHRLDWDDAQRAATPPVNARLSDGADGVYFAPRETGMNSRMALAYFSKMRRRLLKAEVG